MIQRYVRVLLGTAVLLCTLYFVHTKYIGSTWFSLGTESVTGTTEQNIYDTRWMMQLLPAVNTSDLIELPSKFHRERRAGGESLSRRLYEYKYSCTCTAAVHRLTQIQQCSLGWTHLNLRRKVVWVTDGVEGDAHTQHFSGVKSSTPLGEMRDGE